MIVLTILLLLAKSIRHGESEKLKQGTQRNEKRGMTKVADRSER